MSIYDISDRERQDMLIIKGLRRDRTYLKEKLDDIKEVYIDEHKRWATTCGDSSCCACMDLLALLDALNDVLELHGRPVCFEGVPIEWSDH